MRLVADTSALLALAACDQLGLLDLLFQDVRVPAAVYRECVVAGKPHADRLQDYLAGKVMEVDLRKLVIATVGLGRGELEALALYRQLGADVLLADDGRVRKVARLNRIAVIGSLGVLLSAKAHGVLPRIAPALDAMRAAGIHLSAALIAEALRLSGEA